MSDEEQPSQESPPDAVQEFINKIIEEAVASLAERSGGIFLKNEADSVSDDVDDVFGPLVADLPTEVSLEDEKRNDLLRKINWFVQIFRRESLHFMKHLTNDLRYSKVDEDSVSHILAVTAGFVSMATIVWPLVQNTMEDMLELHGGDTSSAMAFIAGNAESIVSSLEKDADPLERDMIVAIHKADWKEQIHNKALFDTLIERAKQEAEPAGSFES